MTLAAFSIGEAAISQATTINGGKKPPPKRTATALSDQKAVPEPR